MSQDPEAMPSATKADDEQVPDYRKLFNPNSNGPTRIVGGGVDAADARTFAARHSYQEPKQLPLELETPKQPKWSGHLVPDSWFEAEKSRDLVRGDTPGGPSYRS